MSKNRYSPHKKSKKQHTRLLVALFTFSFALIGILGYSVIGTGTAEASSCKISDGGLDEASGLVASLKHPGVVYTHNDEGKSAGKGLAFAVNASDCKVVGKLTINNARNDPDPEAITLNHKTGEVWFGDIGNGHPTQPSSMTNKDKKIKYPGLAARILVFKEPTSLSGTISPRVVDIKYSNGDHNSEALLVNPTTGQGYIIGKYASSPVYKLPNPLVSGKATDTGVRIPQWVTDATFSNDGKWIFVRYRTASDPAPTNVLVYDASWKYKGKVTVPKVPQGESITVSHDGASLIIGSEGKNSPLVSAALPGEYATLGDAIPDKVSLADCQTHNRRVITVDSKQYCASREEEAVVAGASECVTVKPNYAKYSYIPNKASRANDYCGYW